MKKRYFGTDGIRGRVGEEPITPETVLKLGWAVGCVLGADGGDRGRVLIGKDTRVSGYLLESALESGLSAAGTDVSLLGPMPTPGIAYLTRTARARAGIVISASHNPYHDNGIKFFSAEGTKLPDDMELAIESAMQRSMRTVDSASLGKAERYRHAAGRYIEFCKSTFQAKDGLDGLTVVVDCANGAAYQIAPAVFAELGAHVIPIADEPDGFNINSECGSTYPATLQKAVRAEGADLGIALDGDGDRVVMVDHAGSYVDGDQILFIIGAARDAAEALNGGIVGTLMSNLGLEHACAARDIPFKRARVGDRYVMSMLQAEGWELGGESSGHIICLDKSTTGDGIVTALQVLAVIMDSGTTLAELKQGMQVFPQTIVNVPTPTAAGDKRRGRQGVDVQHSPRVLRAVRAVEAELGDQGRVLLRASGTEPVIRVMVEGADAKLVERLAQQLADAVKSAAREAA
ncbi:MAG: phosphoglucosamine mutase [Acidiferrobacterales bacterium]